MNTCFRIAFMLSFLMSFFIREAFGSCHFLPGELLHSQSVERSKYYVGLNAGMNFYFGDFTNNRLGNIPFYRRYGVQISMEREISKSFRLSVGFFKGNIMGEEHNAEHNLNFSTSLLIPGVGIMYNVSHLFSRRGGRGRFSTWLFAGVGRMFFNPAGDLKNGTGQTYYYWSDGTVRDLPMNSPNSAQAVTIKRDYHYETDYRKLNMDNAGNYPRSSFDFPVGLSFGIKLNEAWSARVGGLYHFTRTDFLDNITLNSLGSRKGNKAMDKFLFIYAGLFYNIPIAQKEHSTVDQCVGIKSTKVVAKHKRRGNKK